MQIPMESAFFLPKKEGPMKKVCFPDETVIAGVRFLRDEFGSYRPISTKSSKLHIRKPADALPALSNLRWANQEIFAVLTLNGGHQLIKVHEVTRGLVNQSQIHPRETFHVAIADNAVSILLAHNHPSGNVEPSESDLIATRRLVEVSKTLGIPIIDHLIIVRDGFLSLRERFPAYFA
jgi:DNA repair protein RadC